MCRQIVDIIPISLKSRDYFISEEIIIANNAFIKIDWIFQFYITGLYWAILLDIRISFIFKSKAKHTYINILFGVRIISYE